MTNIILMRHGQTEANVTDVFAGFSEPRLTDQGKHQARLAAGYIKNNYHIDRIYSSDLNRAHETALIVGKTLEKDVYTNEGVREIYGGKWEEMHLSDIKREFPIEWDTWSHNLFSCRCPDGESVSDMAHRVLRTVTELAIENSGKTLLVVSHYTPIRAMCAYATEGSFVNMHKAPYVKNTSLSELVFDKGAWSAKETNIHVFLEKLGV